MKTYTNNYGLLAFTIGSVDYISQKKGDTIELPDCNYVKNLVAKGHLTESVKTLKTQK